MNFTQALKAEMARIDKINKIDQTVAIYDSFYALNLKVDAAQYDMVYSFFYERSKNSTTAGNFTVIIFRISQETGVPVTTLLAELRGDSVEKLNVSKKIAYYLNSLKSKTSLYGLAALPLPNQSVARNVVL